MVHGKKPENFSIKIFLNNITNMSNCSASDKHPLTGPLRMYPAAEDNYGTEACSILCLETQPPVLVVATSEGKLHHCLLLNQPVDEDDDGESDSLVSTVQE